MLTSEPNTLEYWLTTLDAMSDLECDGLSRVTSCLLHREQIAHVVHYGEMIVDGVKMTPKHVWIELADGRILDMRARRWFDNQDSVPHGLFVPSDHVEYLSEGHLNTRAEPPVIFYVLANRPIESFPQGLSLALTTDDAQPRRISRPR